MDFKGLEMKIAKSAAMLGGLAFILRLARNPKCSGAMAGGHRLALSRISVTEPVDFIDFKVICDLINAIQHLHRQKLAEL
jgi:hypothetical protein